MLLFFCFSWQDNHTPNLPPLPISPISREGESQSAGVGDRIEDVLIDGGLLIHTLMCNLSTSVVGCVLVLGVGVMSLSRSFTLAPFFRFAEFATPPRFKPVPLQTCLPCLLPLLIPNSGGATPPPYPGLFCFLKCSTETRAAAALSSHFAPFASFTAVHTPAGGANLISSGPSTGCSRL